ncbi:MAG: hypothetical protein AB7T06_27020 [Kofleriaceae bacterium]
MSYHATAAGDVAFTDNVFSEQRGQQDGDLFTQIRPGLRFTYGMPRMIHDLELEAEVTQYALHGSVPSLTGRGGWQGLFIPGPRSEVIVSANASSGVLNAITARTTPDQTAIQLTPLGKVDYQTADASQYASYVLSREYRLSQRLFARASATDDNLEDPTLVTSAEAGATLGFERTFRNSTLGIEAGASIVRMERVAPEGAPMGSRLDRQYNPRVRAAWTYDIDRRFSALLDGGLVYVIPYGTDPYNPDDRTRTPGFFPIVGGQVALVDVWGVATLGLRRDVTPNLLVAQNTVNDIATISGAVPLAWRGESRRRQPKLVAIGAVQAMRTQLIDPITSSVDNSFGIFRLDAGLQYQVRPGFTWTARYEFMLQTSGKDSMGGYVPGFFRNTLFFSFKIRWPEDIAVSVPKRRQNAVRSDRKDLMPIGAEPVIPDLQDGGNGDDDRR